MIFPRPFQVFQDLRFSCQFQKFKNFSCFRAFFDLKQFNRHKPWRLHQNACHICCSITSLYLYSVPAWSSAVTTCNLSQNYKFSMTFKDWQLNYMTFQAWKMKFLNSMTFQVFHDLYEPCIEALSQQLMKLFKHVKLWWTITSSNDVFLCCLYMYVHF